MYCLLFEGVHVTFDPVPRKSLFIGLKLKIFKLCILDELLKYQVGDSRSIVNK